MINVYHDGSDYVMLGERLLTTSTGPEVFRIPGDGTYYDIDVHLPEFTTKGYVHMYADSVTYEGASSEWYYRPKGESSDGHFVARNDGVNSEFSFNSFPVFLGTDGVIQCRGSETTTTLQVMTAGYYLPRGM